MCVVSMIGDHYNDKWYPKPNAPPYTQPYLVNPPVTREEFDALAKDVAEMKELLIRAKAYDEANGEPDCAMDEKIELLRKVADLVDVSLDDVLGKKS